MKKLLAVGALVWAMTVLVIAAPAHAQVETQITDLNSEALDAYQNLDIEGATAKLQEAIGLAEQSGYMGPEVVQSYMNLGVVYAAGAADLDQGLAAFLNAICMQADAQLDPLLSTPDVQQVYMQAQADAQAGACPGGVAAAASAPPATYPVGPQYAQAPATQSGPQILDRECPPGIKCDGDGGSEATPTDFARGFFNVQFVMGLALVQSGMEADSIPPREEIFIQEFVTVPDLTSMDPNATVIEERLFFDDRSAWVPDADSFDDFEDPGFDIPRGVTPVSNKCTADGQESGPLSIRDLSSGEFRFVTDEPSKYCVRVQTPGMVNNLALRLNPGYWITDTFALSVPVRIQFDSGEGTLANMLFGLRAELMFNKMEEATGFPMSWFFGATYGQIQAKPPPKDPNRPAPYVISGPFGAHTGFNFRFRVHRNFGFIIGPEVDVQFPDLLINVDLGAGLEGAF